MQLECAQSWVWGQKSGKGHMIQTENIRRVGRKNSLGSVRKMGSLTVHWQFTDIGLYALECLSIPLSQAVLERVFSLMNSVKTKIRNRMQSSFLSSILHIRTELYEVSAADENVDFDALASATWLPFLVLECCVDLFNFFLLVCTNATKFLKCQLDISMRIFDVMSQMQGWKPYIIKKQSDSFYIKS